MWLDFDFIGEEGEDTDFDAPKVYEPIADLRQLSDRLEMFQSQYNEAVRGGKMDLVFFKVGFRLSELGNISTLGIFRNRIHLTVTTFIHFTSFALYLVDFYIIL